MLAKSIKQLLMAGGFSDPDAFAMIDALCEGGFGIPSVEVLASGNFNIGQGSHATSISTSNQTDDFTLVIIRRQK